MQRSGRSGSQDLQHRECKARGDREKTLQAGAWDYLAKPVDTDQMLAVLRSWLCR